MTIKTWKLKRTTQCKKCPWRKDVDARDIPNGYSIKKHKALECTIASDAVDVGKSLTQQNMPVMACHETQDAHCLGWLANQAGPGNNIPLRYRLMACDNASAVRLLGEQHEHFNETLPKEIESYD